MPLTDERQLLEMLDILAELQSIEGDAPVIAYDFDDYKERLTLPSQKALLRRLERDGLLTCRFVQRQTIKVGFHSKMPFASEVPAAEVSLDSQGLDALKQRLEAKYRPIVLRLLYDDRVIKIEAFDHILGTIKLRDDAKVAIFEALYRNPNRVITREELHEIKTGIRKHVDMSGKFNQMPAYKHVLKRFLPISGAMKMKLVTEITVDQEGYTEITNALNPPKKAE